MEALSPGAAEVIARRYAWETIRDASQMAIEAVSPDLEQLLPTIPIAEQIEI